MTASATANAWIRSRNRVWAEWLGALQIRPHRLRVLQAQRYVEQYRALAGDLATARRLLPRSTTTAALESLYAVAHASIDRSSRHGASQLRALFRARIPAAMRALRPTIAWIALLFALSTGAGLWLITQYPDLIGLFASGAMIDKVEHGQLWTEGMFNIAPSSILSVRILSNNIAVSIFAFCAGVFFGLGAFYITALNGLMLGALFAYTHQHGLDGELLKFVLAHGPVELSVMCIAAAAGTALGESLIRPDAPTRRESFQRAASALGPVLIACALLLIGCGFIEGFISPDARISMPVHAAIGFGYWGLMLLFLRGGVHLHATAPAKTQIGFQHRAIESVGRRQHAGRAQ
jgi:uncharacterized membrane protein SpoIIM required for sporulation